MPPHRPNHVTTQQHYRQTNEKPVETKGKPGKKYCIGGFGEKSNKEVVLKICNHLDKIHPISFSYSSV